ncbi:hypothetical protein [Planococcus sp. YIM B11945]|uniref:hypothetical protein n=1 Tax=Planococcus sp. YIM B11945 TaxID=3435410 RepID=UPI003D7ED220
MKTKAKLVWILAALLMVAGCGNGTTQDGNSENSAAEKEESTSTIDAEGSDMKETNDVSSEETTESEPASTEQDNDALSEYSSEQIEYARVWLQLGPNQAIDGLYANILPAGTPLNPDDETSSVYPEDVIQLAGSRLVDGSVTYSGNGDGTINVYNVPLRWDGEYPAGEEFYKELIENTELVPVDVGEDEEVIRLIELLEIES